MVTDIGRVHCCKSYNLAFSWRAESLTPYSAVKWQISFISVVNLITIRIVKQRVLSYIMVDSPWVIALKSTKRTIVNISRWNSLKNIVRAKRENSFPWLHLTSLYYLAFKTDWNFILRLQNSAQERSILRNQLTKFSSSKNLPYSTICKQ